SNTPTGVFSDTIARLGGQENAFTSWDYTAYFQTVAKQHLPEMMRLEADRMVNLTLTDDLVLPERDVVLEERRSRTENNPGAKLGEMMNAALFMNHPYGRPIIGWRQEVGALTRMDVLEFYEDWYHPGNATLIVAGDLTMDELLPMAEATYGVIPARAAPDRRRPQEPEAFAPRVVTLTDPRVGQPSWRREYLAPSYNLALDEDAPATDPYALQVLSQILGGGPTSRLHSALVREQAIAASAGTYYRPDAFDLGSFGLYLSPRPSDQDPAEALEALEAATDAEVARLLADGITADELDRAKRAMRADAVFARDSQSFGARTIGVAVTTGRPPDHIEDWPERIEAVTAEAVLAAARRVFNDDRSVTGLLLPEPTS
ncbi:MAG: pitrilysin family protein, partial [Pseudomonadota bacterium]